MARTSQGLKNFCSIYVWLLFPCLPTYLIISCFNAKAQYNLNRSILSGKFNIRITSSACNSAEEKINSCGGVCVRAGSGSSIKTASCSAAAVKHLQL